jgi:predicted O-methyltransferase YrrM
MEPAITELLRAYERRSEQEWKLVEKLGQGGATASIDDFLLSVGPRTGQFMNAMVRDAKARRVLEIGTSYGYSTVWLAEALRDTGGELTTIEIHVKKQAYAREQLTAVGLAERVKFELGDALEILALLKGHFDFVLLDLWKDLYIPCFDLFLPKLAPGAYVVADNMLEPPMARPQADAYQRHVRESGRFDTLLLPIGSGLEVSRLVK